MDWSERKLRSFSIRRNKDLRQGYRVQMARYTQEELMFLDESIFNEKSGWRHKILLLRPRRSWKWQTQARLAITRQPKSHRLGTRRILLRKRHNTPFRLTRNLNPEVQLGLTLQTIDNNSRRLLRITMHIRSSK